MDYIIGTSGKNPSIAVRDIIGNIPDIKRLLYKIDIDLNTIFLLIQNKQFYHTYKEKDGHIDACSPPIYTIADLYIDDFMYVNIMKYIAAVEKLNDLFFEFTDEEENYKYTTEYIFERPFYVLKLLTIITQEGKLGKFLGDLYEFSIPVDLVIKNCTTSEVEVNTETGLGYRITNEIDNSFARFDYLKEGLDGKYVALGLKGIKNSHVLCSLSSGMSDIDCISQVVNSTIHLRSVEDLEGKQDTIPYHILATTLSGLSITTPENDAVYIYGSNYSEAFNEKHLFRGTVDICISQEAYESNPNIMDLQGALVPGGFLISRIKVYPAEEIQVFTRNATSTQNPHLKICTSGALSNLSLTASKLICSGQTIDLSFEAKADSIFNYNYFYAARLYGESMEKTVGSPVVKGTYENLLAMMKVDEEQCFIWLRVSYPKSLLPNPDKLGQIHVEGIKELLYNFKKQDK